MEDISEENLLSNALDNFTLDNYETALNQINSILNKFPSSPKKSEYLLYRSIILSKQGKYEEALKDLDEIEKDSNNIKEYTYYLTRGKVLYYLGKFEDSKKVLNIGLESNKNNENIFNQWIKKVEDELKQ